MLCSHRQENIVLRYGGARDFDTLARMRQPEVLGRMLGSIARWKQR
jgi:hypothetical protein